MKKVLLGIVAAGILFAGGCVALVAGGPNAADKAIKDEERNNEPTEVTVGEAFTYDDWAVAAGRKLRKDALGSAEIVGEVSNNGDSARNAVLTFKVLKAARSWLT